MMEEWRPVVGWEGAYEVSSEGRVRNPRSGRLLKGWVDIGGYFIISARDNGRKGRLRVHRMVLEAFVGPAPSGYDGCHNDGDRQNNRVENLRWDTRSENILDAVRQGTHHLARRTHCPRGHPLISPNLVASEVRKGHRQCRACNCAYAYAWRHNIEFTKELADHYYTQIINTEAAIAA